jgi:hypothetical protein
MAYGLTLVGLLLAACSAPTAPPENRTSDQRAVGEWADSFRADLVAWQADRDRVGALVSQCPGSAQPMQLSSGAAVRDGIRQDRQLDISRRAADVLNRGTQRQTANQGLLDATASLSLADWQLRRAASEGRSDLCANASAALTKADQSAQSAKDGGAELVRSVNLAPQW